VIPELHIAGWDLDYGSNGVVLTDDDCINMSFSHPEMTNVSLSVHICLDELPAIVYVNLLDANGVIEEEWRDAEIDADDITERARELSEEQLEEED
jgi:hypothetical protein